MGRIIFMIKGLISAIGFLTIIPVKSHNITERTLFWFPLVGLSLGVILVILNSAFIKFFPSNLNIIILLTIYIMLTGALHLDGFADTVDAIAGGNGNKNRILEIMSDSHIGSIGVVALICLLGLKYVSLINLTGTTFNKVLLIMPLMGRWSMVFSMLLSKPAKTEGLGKYFISNVSILSVILSTLITAIFLFLLLGQKCVYILGAVIIVVLLINLFFNKILGGITGDILGAVCEISELTTLLVLQII